MDTLLRKAVFNIHTRQDFEQAALSVFKYQYDNNKVYAEWCRLCGCSPFRVHSVSEIPFLPIEFFKTHTVASFQEEPIDFFQSSGTTRQNKAIHYIKDFELYEKSFFANFQLFFGNPEQYTFIVLLPNYQQQGHSSLIYMMQRLIKESGHTESGFYPEDYARVAELLNELNRKKRKTILFGVTYALSDLVEHYRFRLQNTVVIETGGMKGRRKELIREDLHRILKEGFGVAHIASEYGMCELFSQAYSKRDGIFYTPPQMQVILRDVNDPFSSVRQGKTGGINIIDLANLDSCAFIATQDLGRSRADGGFELLGRFEHSDVRGCNLLFPQYQKEVLKD